MADGGAKKKTCKQGNLGRRLSIPGSPGGVGGDTPPREVTAVADEIVLKLKNGDKDYRHFRQGFAVTRMPDPEQKGEKEKRQERAPITDLSQTPDLPQSPEKNGALWGEATAEEQTPVKKRGRIPKEKRGLPPRSTVLECIGRNPNDKRADILERWKKPVKEALLEDFLEIGFDSREQMQEAITEEFTARRDTTPEKAWKPATGWKGKGGYPMQEAGTYSPTTQLDEWQKKKEAQFVEWQYNSAIWQIKLAKDY